MKKFFSAILSVVIRLFCLCVLLAMITVSAGAETFEAGDIFTFGRYEQDNDTSNGTETIEWIVLEAQDGKILLISRYGLEAQPYHSEQTEVSWETCSLRSWLNDDFLNAAFTEEEQAQLIAYPDDDLVSLLNMKEKTMYFPSEEEGICYATDYAAAHDARIGKTGGSCWWLRWDENHDFAPKVESKGKIGQFGDSVSYNGNVVRPVVIIQMPAD